MVLVHTDLVVHLFWAVEHIHHDTEGSPQILGGLCLACTSRPSRSAAHDQMERLRQSDVASRMKETRNQELVEGQSDEMNLCSGEELRKTQYQSTWFHWLNIRFFSAPTNFSTVFAQQPLCGVANLNHCCLVGVLNMHVWIRLPKPMMIVSPYTRSSRGIVNFPTLSELHN